MFWSTYEKMIKIPIDFKLIPLVSDLSVTSTNLFSVEGIWCCHFDTSSYQIVTIIEVYYRQTKYMHNAEIFIAAPK